MDVDLDATEDGLRVFCAGMTTPDEIKERMQNGVRAR